MSCPPFACLSLLILHLAKNLPAFESLFKRRHIWKYHEKEAKDLSSTVAATDDSDQSLRENWVSMVMNDSEIRPFL